MKKTGTTQFQSLTMKTYFNMSDEIEIDKAIDRFEILQAEQKKIGVYLDLKQLALARIGVVKWMRNLEKQKSKLSSKEHKKRVQQINSFSRIIDGYERMGEINFTLKRKIIYLEKSMEEVSWIEEKKLMQEWILNQSQQLENYEKLLAMHGIIKITGDDKG